MSGCCRSVTVPRPGCQSDEQEEKSQDFVCLVKMVKVQIRRSNCRLITASIALL